MKGVVYLIAFVVSTGLTCAQHRTAHTLFRELVGTLLPQRQSNDSSVYCSVYDSMKNSPQDPKLQVLGLFLGAFCPEENRQCGAWNQFTECSSKTCGHQTRSRNCTCHICGDQIPIGQLPCVNINNTVNSESDVDPCEAANNIGTMEVKPCGPSCHGIGIASAFIDILSGAPETSCLKNFFDFLQGRIPPLI
ncbi:PREDICTED: uncharacterized protein LOC106812317 [Priapulus caudatus]|uniref:Uncharacterized protein LOC106812317 n=1 Tax=Priapulus caudatus TaxID=37621 RepID=A0ABM1EHH2_PRICU|nr:PREDICTED: uncharacterized protein LOC106812317 [Priapulus caudatus]